MEIFAKRLKELRLDKGLSFEQLATETGISSSSLCRWENEQAEIKAQQLIILSKFFCVTTDYLLGLED